MIIRWCPDCGGYSALSATEEGVLDLIRAGLTDAEIAKRLAVHPSTARKHTQHIYAKIGVNNRAAATGWWYLHNTFAPHLTQADPP